MKKGFSLIEMIISIVIISIVFIVIPKVISTLNRAESFAIKEDAMFNGISLMSIISKLPWDEGNVDNMDILQVNSGQNVCSPTNTNPFYRAGGFIGSRDCNSSGSLSSAGAISKEGSFFNDIDDYHNFNQVTLNQITNNPQYGFDIDVTYLNDNIIVYNYTNQSAILTLNSIISPNSTNIKGVKMSVTYQGARVSERNSSIASFNYYSPNIGQIYLHGGNW